MSIKEMDKEQVKAWVLSEVLLEISECRQILDRNFTNDEWLVSDVSFFSKDYDFTIFNKNSQRCDNY